MKEESVAIIFLLPEQVHKSKSFKYKHVSNWSF